jgi:hypothetical protein
MSDEQDKLDDERQSLLTELWETPLGRRSVLKAGLASAAALGVGSIAAPDAEGAKRKKRRRVERTDLHFALGHVRGVSQLTLHANGERIALKRLTNASREALRRQGGLWAAADLSQLTHHVAGVKLPADRGLIVSVRGKRGRREVLVAQLLYAPRAEVIAHARRSHRATGSFKHVAGSPRRLTRLGLNATDVRSVEEVAQLATVVDEYTTAEGLTSFHPSIANMMLAVATRTTLSQTPAITALSTAMARVQKNNDDIADFPTVKNADGSAAMIKIPIVQNGTVVGYKTTGFTTFRLNPQNDAGFARAVKAGLIGGIRAVRNDPALGAVISQPLEQDQAASTRTWVQPQGVLPQPQPVTSARKGAGIDIQVKNPGFWYGTQTSVSSGYNNGQVALTLNNNFVRWVWVYVQYIGKDGENLSANPNATLPNTRYSESLGLLPQVFTVLGVPVWGKNSIGVTLNYPKEAHTARLLFCGLGSSLLDGTWRQYFPADAYLDSSGNPLIAPTTEVLVPALMTGILTIGLTGFALATAIDVALAWVALKRVIDEGITGLPEAFAAVVDGTIPLTATETFAATVAAGGATYADISSNGGSTANIWSILLAFASIIPRVIFSPAVVKFWGSVAEVLGGFEVGDKLTEAIPGIGEVVAIIEAAGDAITLAEAVTETIISPWVIENEVNLTYPAMITINHDPLDATFPKTARSYRLEAKVDGAVVLDPVTGSVNPGGVAQSKLEPVSVTAPFGGRLIQWSVVFLNASGQQVGTGVSGQFVNDDPNNVTSQVSITITELMVPIDSRTAFTRAVTTGYNSNPGGSNQPGYTWSSQIADNGTVGSTGIQQVMSTTVSTLAGVVGVVWEQGDNFYVRGVPVAQNGTTIAFGPASMEGYTRRPFLLFDAFVKPGDQGNHVLLEPDPSTTAYHVRKVTLDPTTGAPTWDSSTSDGDFLLPVSAAALHSSGRVVVVETDTGRLGMLLPAPPPFAAAQAVQAIYSAGPGTQVGLLGSPIAIAVTNPGTVVVLEAAGGAHGMPQLSAFDLTGSPVQYFQPPVTRRGLIAAGRRRGAGAQGQYTIPLVSAGTYLDLAIDGSEQIYVLYHTGSGTSTSDYHVDVYTPAGAVLNDHIVGVNVPHLAVDYWRSMYAGNYDPLIDITTKQPHIDPKLGVAEPSVSRFDPVELTGRKPPKRHKPPRKHKRPKKHEPPKKHKPRPEGTHKHKRPRKHK